MRAHVGDLGEPLRGQDRMPEAAAVVRIRMDGERRIDSSASAANRLNAAVPDTDSLPTQTAERTSLEPPRAPSARATGSIRTTTGSIRTDTAAIRTLGPNPATAPIMLHPGDSLPHRRRVLYIVLLGALTALGPFTIDLYLPAFPVLEQDFQTTAAAIQLTLTGTMLGFALGQLIVGPLSDKVGRRIPLLSVTALHVARQRRRRRSRPPSSC